MENFRKKYNDKDNVPRPDHWSGWNLKQSSIEFWLDGDNRIHARLKYSLAENNNWIKNLLSPYKFLDKLTEVKFSIISSTTFFVAVAVSAIIFIVGSTSLTL